MRNNWPTKQLTSNPDSRSDRYSKRGDVGLADALGDGELEPMLVARVDGALYVVDGHHRMKAHRRAGRRSARVRILDMGAATAVMASKLVNCGGAKLPLHAEQARECAWQALVADTACGTRAPSMSDRAYARAFGTSRETIGSMRRRLPDVNPADYSADACDPGTDWPRWKHVKGNAIRDRHADVPEHERQRAQDERNAAKLAAMLVRIGAEAFRCAVALLKDEAAADALADLAEAAEAADAY